MKLVDVLFILLAESACVSQTNKTFVDYMVVPSESLGKNILTCAKSYTGNRFLAARVNDVSGACEGLTWDWGSDPHYESGFSYIKKTKTIDIFNPVVDITERFKWLIPGSFGVGGRLELYFTMPTGADWTGFSINVVDTVNHSFQLYDGETEIFMVHIIIQRSSSLGFKTWNSYTWININFISPMPFADGSTHKLTMVPLTDAMTILFDDVELAHYTHPADPATAKQLYFSPFSGTTLKLHNISFVDDCIFAPDVSNWKYHFCAFKGVLFTEYDVQNIN